MILSSLDELKKFDLIILSDDKIDSRSIANHIENDKKILVLFINQNISKNINLLKKSLKNVSFNLFSWALFNHKYYESWHSHKLAINNSKVIFQALEKKNKILINFVKKLYSSNDIKFGFEKSISLQLKEYYEKIKIYELLKLYNNNIIPITDKRKYIYLKKITEENKLENIYSDYHAKVLFYKRKIIDFNYFFNIFIFIFYPFYALLCIRKFSLKKIIKKTGLRIYKQGTGFGKNKFPLDWLIDNKNFNNENTFFVIEDRPNADHINSLINNRYDFHFCNSRKPLYRCSLKLFFQIIFFYIPLGFISLPIICFTNQSLRNEAVIAWIKFFAWKNFISIFEINSYLSYHNYTSDHIYRNIMLKKINCTTIMYKHTHSENIFDYKKKDKYSNADLMNLYYDIEYHWSKCSIEMSKSNESKSKKFLISGPIWASTEFLNNDYKININKGEKLIVLYASSFQTFNAVNSLNAHNKFLLLALEIIKNYPKTNVIFKSKKPLDFYKNYEETNELMKNLSGYKNFHTIDNSVFSTAVSKTSDIVISMSFASTGFEAMCMGIKSFYVDLMNTYNNSYFDNFENLVSHSNLSALNNLEFWMKINKNEVLPKYEQMFENLDIKKTNKAAEIIRDRILEISSN